ncbi:hypothetical protein MHYP_G00203580 [Metynnis hypsauchen]
MKVLSSSWGSDSTYWHCSKWAADAVDLQVKNGQPVINKPNKYNKLYLESASTENVLQYSCALGAPEGPLSPEAPKGSEAPEDANKSSVLKFITVGSSVFLALIITTGLQTL